MPSYKGKSKALQMMHEAKVSKKLNFFKHCAGKAVVKSIHEYTPDDDPITRFKIVFKVLESRPLTDDMDKLPAEQTTPNKVGEEVSFICKLQKKTWGPASAKAAIYALFDVDKNTCPDEEYESTYMELTGHELDEKAGEWKHTGANPGRGRILEYKGRLKPAKDDKGEIVEGKYFSVTDFYHVPQTEEEIAAECAKLDAEEAPSESDGE